VQQTRLWHGGWRRPVAPSPLRLEKLLGLALARSHLTLRRAGHPPPRGGPAVRPAPMTSARLRCPTHEG